MRRALVVMTCPRPRGASYLESTLASLEVAGADAWGQRHVISDGHCTYRSGWDLTAYAGPSGTRAALWRAFGLALATGADEVMICEDDVVACRNALRHAARQTVPAWAAFASYFEMFELERFPAWTPGEVMRWQQIPVHGRGRRCHQYAGTQALVFPRATLLYLVSCDPRDPALEREMPFGPEIAPHASDCAMGWHLDRWHLRDYACHVPSLFRHVGVESAWCGDRRPGIATLPQARSYPGDDFDALAVPL